MAGEAGLAGEARLVTGALATRTRRTSDAPFHFSVCDSLVLSLSLSFSISLSIITYNYYYIYYIQHARFSHWLSSRWLGAGAGAGPEGHCHLPYT